MVVLDSDLITSTSGSNQLNYHGNTINGATIVASQAGASRVLLSGPSTRNGTSNYTPLRKTIDRAASTRLHYIGRPGSRRYQRYLNRNYLLENEKNITPDDLLVFVKTSTPLSKVLQDSNHSKNWDPFVSISEEKQENLLKKLSKDNETDNSDARRESSASASYSYGLIDLKIRKMFKKTRVLECEFFDSLDREITAFIKDNNSNDDDSDDYNNFSLTYTFDCTYQRMICHGICQYYQLKSQSKSVNSDSNKIVIVKKKKNLTSIPNETLSMHLQNIQTRR